MLRFAMDMMFKAAIYLRLSKEDGGFSYGGGKQESDSIASQRMLIRDFLKKHPPFPVREMEGIFVEFASCHRSRFW